MSNLNATKPPTLEEREILGAATIEDLAISFLPNDWITRVERIDQRLTALKELREIETQWRGLRNELGEYTSEQAKEAFRMKAKECRVVAANMIDELEDLAPESARDSRESILLLGIHSVILNCAAEGRMPETLAGLRRELQNSSDIPQSSAWLRGMPMVISIISTNLRNSSMQE